MITAKTNPIGGKYHEFIDGISAYFKVINDKGGIYGRKLVVVSDRDDVVGTQNVQQTTSSLANDNAFATFEATQQLTAADMLAKAHMPTFIWNIDPEMASTPTSDHSNIFGTNAAICFSCPGPLNSWLAVKNGFTKVGDPRLRRLRGVEVCVRPARVTRTSSTRTARCRSCSSTTRCRSPRI